VERTNATPVVEACSVASSSGSSALDADPTTGTETQIIPPDNEPSASNAAHSDQPVLTPAIDNDPATTTAATGTEAT